MDLVFSYFYKQLFYVFGATKDINGCAETVNKGIENKKKKKKKVEWKMVTLMNVWGKVNVYLCLECLQETPSSIGH